MPTFDIQKQAYPLDDSRRHEFDVIVIGGGHAGCEAATAAARLGARVALVTQRLDTIGELSCNPSIGGIGKGHLVREIDALDGCMGAVADAAGIHYRLLNRSKGPAVRGPRAQMDRDLYQYHMQQTLTSSLYNNLSLIQASAQDLLLDEKTLSTGSSMGPMHENERARIRGVVVHETVLDDNGKAMPGTRHEIYAPAVVITTGTFLRGVLLLGQDKYVGGRHLRDSDNVEPPSTALAETLAKFQFPLGRLKTGTPARLNGNTIEYDACIRQPTELPAQPFSHLLQFQNEQPTQLAAGRFVDCYQTATGPKTHELVLQYAHLLPSYDGGPDGTGNGPRYCPSIYKKVQRFPDRSSHNTFLEPEGLLTSTVYPNGMSGPYPPEIQLKILRTMKGLGAVEIIKPGYDVEYDFGKFAAPRFSIVSLPN
jgi:tRNA uridine 5-carboxymethylaminomethyl modification enzyme